MLYHVLLLMALVPLLHAATIPARFLCTQKTCQTCNAVANNRCAWCVGGLLHAPECRNANAIGHDAPSWQEYACRPGFITRGPSFDKFCNLTVEYPNKPDTGDCRFWSGNCAKCNTVKDTSIDGAPVCAFCSTPTKGERNALVRPGCYAYVPTINGLNVAACVGEIRGAKVGPGITHDKTCSRVPIPTKAPTPQPTPRPTPRPTPAILKRLTLARITKAPTPNPTPPPAAGGVNTDAPTPEPTPMPTPVPTPPPPPTPAPTPTAEEQYQIDCRLGKNIEKCPCMSTFDCKKGPGMYYECHKPQAESQFGFCRSVSAPTPKVLNVGDQVVIGTEADPQLMGWHVILICFVACFACMGGAYIVYWAHNSVDANTIDLDAAGANGLMDSGSGTINATALNILPSHSGGVDPMAAAMGNAADTSVGQYGAVPDAPTNVSTPMYDETPANGVVLNLNCPECGKLYHFQSDLDTHLQLRHGGGTINGFDATFGSFNGDTTYLQR